MEVPVGLEPTMDRVATDRLASWLRNLGVTYGTRTHVGGFTGH